MAGFKLGDASALRRDTAALAQEAAMRPRWLREEAEMNAFEAGTARLSGPRRFIVACGCVQNFTTQLRHCLNCPVVLAAGAES